MPLSISSSQLSSDLDLLKREPALLDGFASPAPARSGASTATINADTIQSAVDSSYAFTSTIRDHILDRRNDQSLAQIGKQIDQVKAEATALQTAAERL